MQNLLLLPGLLCSQRVFSSLPHLRHQAGVRIRVPATHSHDTIENLAKAVLDSAPSRFALCGFSFGGYAALEILRQAPERLTGIALLSSQAAADSASTKQRRLDQVSAAQRGIDEGDDAAGEAIEEVIAQQLPLLLHRRHLDARDSAIGSAPEAAASLRLIDTVRAMAFEVGAAGFVQQQRAIMSRGDRRPELLAAARAGLPIAIIAGKQDLLIPPAVPTQLARALLQSHPAATAGKTVTGAEGSPPGAAAPASSTRPWVELTMIDDCGHMSPLEQPLAVGAALNRWLAALLPA